MPAGEDRDDGVPGPDEEGDRNDPDTDVILARAGIELFADQPDHPAWHECLRAGQRMLRRGCRSIGLVPASAQIGAVGIGVNLAVALRDLTGKKIGYVDANLRWPALQLEAPTTDPWADEDSMASIFTQRWLRRDVALLVPRRFLDGGAGVGPLQSLLTSMQRRFAHCIVDLTGWKRLGEHLSAFSVLDGVAVVARAGVTTELELMRLGLEIPAERHLGILLTGAAASPELGGKAGVVS